MNKFWLLCYLVGCLACRPEHKNIKVVTGPASASKYLTGESLHLFELMVHPIYVYCFDSLLFVCENTNESKMLIYDPNTQTLVNSLIPTGRGPGEQIGTFFFTYDTLHRKIFSFDVTLRKILEIDRDSVRFSGYQPLKTYHFPSEMRFSRGDQLNDSCFVMDGREDSRAIIFSLDGKMKKLGKSPAPDRPISRILNEAYDGNIKAAPSGDKFVIACLQTDQLEIFHLGEDEQLYVRGPEWAEPRYETKAIEGYEVLVHLDDEKDCYSGVCVTNDRIYALYSGKKVKRGVSRFSHIIRVFSWEGEYLMDYVLDKPIAALCLDEKASYIYGIASEPGAEIYRFKYN